MYAKYKSENFFLGWVNDVRESMLGYSHTLFGEILDLADSGSYYLCRKTRGDYLRPDILIRVFIAEYNFKLFIKKYDQMKKILEEAVDQGIIKPDVKLEDIYPQTRVSIKLNFNQYQLKPPTSIFTEQICLIPEEFFVDEDLYREHKYKIFAEKKFDRSLRYLPMITDGKISELYVLDGERLEEYISQRTDELIEECKNSEHGNLQDVYWLYAMNMLYKEVHVSDTCFQHLLRLYPGFKKDGWGELFDNLAKNDGLKSPHIYNDENAIYFKDSKNNPITKENLPIFYIKYNFDDLKRVDDIVTYEKKIIKKNSKKDLDTVNVTEETTETAEEKDIEEIKEVIIPTSYFKRKCIKAHQKRMKFIDVYMLFAQSYRNAGKNEDEVFINTCYLLSTYNIFVPFKDTNIMKLWKEQDTHFGDETNFILEIGKLFEELPISERRIGLQMLKNNILTDPIKFCNTVAVDFSFISKISTAMCRQLCKELEETTNDFKKRNNIS